MKVIHMLNKLFQLKREDNTVVDLLIHQDIGFHEGLRLYRMGLPSYGSFLCEDLAKKSKNSIDHSRIGKVLKDLILIVVLGHVLLGSFEED